MGRDAVVRASVVGILLFGFSASFTYGAELTPNATGGEWAVDDLDGSEGKWHSYSSKLSPVTDSGVAEITKATGANISPSDEADYFIDSKKPTIKKIFPDGNKIDPSNPQIIYEIDDGKNGSGLSLFGGKTESVTVDVNSPTPHGKKKLFFEENGITKMRVVISVDSYLLKDESYKVEITATDRVGNVATKSESFDGEELKESYQLIDSIKSNPGFETDPSNGVYCRYKYPTDIRAKILAVKGDGAIVTGEDNKDSVKIIFTASSPAKDILSELKFDIEGPATYEISEESSEDVKVILLIATNGAKNGEQVKLSVTYPSEAEGDYASSFRIGDEAGLVNGGTEDDYLNEYNSLGGVDSCFNRIRSKDTLRCKGGDGLFGLESFCSFRFGLPLYDKNGESIKTEQFKGSPSILTDKTASRSYVFSILESLPVPTGSFEYDQDKKELTYSIETTRDIDFDLGRSSSEIVSNIGYTANKRMVKQGGGYKFVFSNIEEGNYNLRVTLFGFGFFDDNSNTKNPYYQLEDSYEVKGAPPQITNFTYNYSNSLLTIQVDDTGTPRDQLSGTLIIEGKSYEVIFDKDGAATFRYPQPLESENILLLVSDLSQQKNQKILGVLGAKEFDSEEAGAETYNVVGGLPANSQGYVGQGPIVNGRQSFLYCSSARKSRTRTSSRNNTSIPTGYSAVFRGPLSPIQYLDCSNSGYCSASSRKANARGSGGRPISGTSGSSSGGCLPPRLLDRFAPVISNFVVDADSSIFSADITDSGGPLDSLKVSYSVQENARRAGVLNVDDAGSKGTYDKQGRVEENYPADAEREIVEVFLTARDSSNNYTSATKKVITPKSPPNINFSHVAINDAIGSTLLFAEFQDRSGIDVPLTELSIDGVPCVSKLLSAGQVNSAVHQGTLKWVCRAELKEGMHIFSAKGVDGVGLLAQAQYPFDINYKPVIINFALNDVNPEEVGVNVFSAQIEDLGKDVVLGGLELSIDGQLVPRSQYLFDSVSGQFNALGPIIISEGLHTAQLRVSDSRGNTDTKSLPFGRINNLVVNDAGEGDLQLDRVSVWELQNANGDGLINPGELVRLFPSFINVGALPLVNLRVTANVNELGLNVETPSGSIDSIAAGQTASLLDGIDLRVDTDFLRREGLQEKVVSIEFLVTDGVSGSWRFVSDVLIREPRESYQVVEQSTNNSTAVLSASNILPSISLNTPPNITLPVFDVGGRNVAYTGTLDPADSTIESVTFSFNGGAATEIAGVGAIGGGGLGLPVLRFGGSGSVTGNTYSFSEILNFGNHVVVVTLRTADGDVVIVTDNFTF